MSGRSARINMHPPLRRENVLICRWLSMPLRWSPPVLVAGKLGCVLIEHRGVVPEIDPSAYVAPTAVVCGAVRIGPGARILFGAVLTAEDGQVSVGARSVVMENAVLRGRAGHPVVVGDDVLVGPHAHVNGARVGDGCFLATGAALFPGCVAGAGSEVRIHGVVQVNTVLPPGTTVPIGWVAVGDPARIFPPGQHEQIWEIQESLDFPGTVYGVTGDTPAAERMSRQSAWFAAHRPSQGRPAGQGTDDAARRRGVHRAGDARRDRRHQPVRKRRKLASWAGLTPTVRGSDLTLRHGHISKQGASGTGSALTAAATLVKMSRTCPARLANRRSHPRAVSCGSPVPGRSGDAPGPGPQRPAPRRSPAPHPGGAPAAPQAAAHA